MFEVMRGWINRYLSDEEAVIFAFILLLTIVLFIALGSVMAPLLVAVVVAFVMQGAVKNMMKYRVPKTVAVGLTYVVFLSGTFGFVFLIIPRVWRQLTRLFQELPNMVLRGQELLLKLPEYYPDLVSEQQVADWVQFINAEIAQFGQQVVSFSISQIPLLATLSVYTLVVPVLVFFLLKDRDQLLAWGLSFLPAKRPLMNRIATEMNEQLANYVRGKVVEILIAGGVTFLLFRAFELEYATLLALMVGVSVIIPYIGVVVVTAPVTIIAYAQFGGTSDFLYLLVGYTIIQALDGLVLVPLLFSEVVNLHPVAIITAVIVFGSLWGLWGVFFAIPLATLIKAIMNAWPRKEKNMPAGEVV